MTSSWIHIDSFKIQKHKLNTNELKLEGMTRLSGLWTQTSKQKSAPHTFRLQITLITSGSCVIMLWKVPTSSKTSSFYQPDMLTPHRTFCCYFVRISRQRCSILLLRTRLWNVTTSHAWHPLQLLQIWMKVSMSSSKISCWASTAGKCPDFLLK